MTIDEIITTERDNAEFSKRNNYDGSADYHNQIAELLEELKSYRTSVFSGDMTQKMLKEQYDKAIDDFAEKLKSECREHYIDCDPYFGGITDSILYEDDIEEIAEQLKAGERNEQASKIHA